ncbi:hypothetical protein [Allokutzneria oryzae]|uniref:Uncharacterized protein n=1 Tax=Allokutzneria oryzae TaxID=1378989 RepID=A0ABV5ZS16_9PSEU
MPREPDMIDLDESLSPWREARPWVSPFPEWGEAAAYGAATAVARRGGLTLKWEPGDEEWILLAGEKAYEGMCSLFFPLFLAVPDLVPVIATAAPLTAVVPITDFGTEDLRCSPDLLRATLLRYGWNDDFDPEAFCAHDLFVESI